MVVYIRLLPYAIEPKSNVLNNMKSLRNYDRRIYKIHNYNIKLALKFKGWAVITIVDSK